jgi:hypothetical protein
MRMRVAFSALVLWVAFAASAEAANMREDPSCTEVNRAYLKTRSYPNYSVDMPLIKSDGTRKPYKHFKFSEKGFLSKYAFQDQWKAFPRPTATIFDRGSEPKFTDCKLNGERKEAAHTLKLYTAEWHNFPFAAKTEIWISAEDGLIRRVMRHSPDDNWMFSEAMVEEVFEYHSPPPPPPPAPAQAN